MKPDLKVSRSRSARRLGEFPNLLFHADLIASNQGRWRDHFSRRIGTEFNSRIILEIGCFDASFLHRIARLHPHPAFIGLDWKCKQIVEGAAQISADGATNIALLHARAQDLDKIFAPGEVDECWIFHPEPCDRPNEIANRLFAPRFLGALHRALKDSGASIFVKTDHPGYYQWMLGLLGEPEPPWFQPARDAYLHKAKSTLPRVRARDLLATEAVPKPSDEILRQFKVKLISHDFWNDRSAQKQTANRCFSGQATVYESRFIAKRLPIYLVELEKKVSA